MVVKILKRGDTSRGFGITETGESGKDPGRTAEPQPPKAFLGINNLLECN